MTVLVRRTSTRGCDVPFLKVGTASRADARQIMRFHIADAITGATARAQRNREKDEATFSLIRRGRRFRGWQAEEGKPERW